MVVRLARPAQGEGLRRGPQRKRRARSLRGNVVAAATVLPEEADVIIIGAGIGGLCAGAVLSWHGYSVCLLESHTSPGGAAHGFERGGYSFETGPSFHAGLSPGASSASPLRTVLSLIGEEVNCVQYDRWQLHLPEGTFKCSSSAEKYREELRKRHFGGEDGLRQFVELERILGPTLEAAAALPAAALRWDMGAALTVPRYWEALAKSGPVAGDLQGAFGNLLRKAGVKNVFLKNLLDLECFMLSGLPADGTIAAEMAYMFGERSRPGATIDYPLGGTKAIVDALVRGIEKKGNSCVHVRKHVERVIVENGRAVGVSIKGGTKVRARVAVISNSSVWNTMDLLDAHDTPSEYRRKCEETPQTNSFMHLHLGFDATGLPSGGDAWKELDCHHIVVNDWNNSLDSQDNAIGISMPSVFDSTMAPVGKHVVHAYCAANEPYNVWKSMDTKSQAYKDMKEQRSQVLWRALERVIPDIRERADLALVGTPLTHEKFLRRKNGTYGPAIIAGEATFPGPTTPIKGLFCCGDSVTPGIGVPAVAASGLIAANTVVPVWEHWKLLDAVDSMR